MLHFHLLPWTANAIFHCHITQLKVCSAVMEINLLPSCLPSHYFCLAMDNLLHVFFLPYFLICYMIHRLIWNIEPNCNYNWQSDWSPHKTYISHTLSGICTLHFSTWQVVVFSGGNCPTLLGCKLVHVCENPQNRACFSKTCHLRGHLSRFTLKMNIFPSMSWETQ